MWLFYAVRERLYSVAPWLSSTREPGQPGFLDDREFPVIRLTSR
jgi:hypothetical protein